MALSLQDGYVRVALVRYVLRVGSTTGASWSTLSMFAHRLLKNDLSRLCCTVESCPGERNQSDTFLSFLVFYQCNIYTILRGLLDPYNSVRNVLERDSIFGDQILAIILGTTLQYVANLVWVFLLLGCCVVAPSMVRHNNDGSLGEIHRFLRALVLRHVWGLF